MGELGQTGEGPAFLARDRSTHELVAVRGAGPAGGLSVIHALDSSVPATPRSCPICRTTIHDWRRFCDQCGTDLSGVDVEPEGLDARRVVEEVLRTSERPVDLLGPMKRAEGGGDIWFGCDRQTGEIVALDLRRGAGPGRPGYSVSVTAVLRSAGSAGRAPAGGSPSGGSASRPADPAPSPVRAAADAGPGVKLCPSCGKEYGRDVRFCPDDGSVLRLRQAADSLVGQIIADRYLVHRKIGQGGMGQVYQAEHVRMGQRCAIKVLSPELSNDVQAVSRFAREATNASRINDIHVAHIYDFGESPQHGVYLAMEYVEGEPLARMIAATGAIPDERTIDIASQVASALGAAHAEGVVHRDLTPNNIMIARAHDGSDLVKVVDFGIAKATDDLAGGLTRTGFVIGTPQYMSPEQLLAETVDGRSDIYQLGCVMFEMLTGSPPFGTAGGADQITKRLTGAAPKPIDRRATIAPALSDIVAKALSRAREDRFQTAGELRAALSDAALAGSTGRSSWSVPVEEASRDDDAARSASPVTGGDATPRARSGRSAVAGPPAQPLVTGDAETLIRETPSSPPRLSSKPSTGGARTQSPGSERHGPTTGSADGQKPASSSQEEAATLLAPRTGPQPHDDRPPPPDRRRHLIIAAVVLASMVTALTIIGTVGNPIRVGPIRFGFGDVPASPPLVGSPETTPAPVATDPAAGQPPEQQPAPEPTGVRIASALPSGAVLLVDGRRVATDEDFITLPPGEHELQLQATGFRSVRERVVVGQSGEARWAPRLERLAAEPRTSTTTRPAESQPVTRRDSPVASGAGARPLPDPPAAGQSTAPSLPVAFGAAATERIETFRQALVAKDLGSIRRYLTQERIREFGDIFDRSGSTPLRVTARDVAPDSVRARATFLLRIDEVGGATLLPFGEFMAEFQKLSGSGAWQLIAIDRRQ